MIRETALRKMETAEFGVKPVPTELKFRIVNHERLFELEIWPSARAIELASEERCDCCGRISGSVPRDFVVDGSTLDPAQPFQRIEQFPTTIICNERMADFIRLESLTDILLTPVIVK